MSGLPDVLDNAAIDRIIAEPGLPREATAAEEATLRREIQRAARLALYWPKPKHASKRKVLDPMLAQRRISQESPEEATAERARRKLQAIYEAHLDGLDALDTEVPRTPQQNYERSLPAIDAFLDAERDELAGRPRQRDSYTALLLFVFERLFGENPARATMQHKGRRRASIARKRRGKDGQPKESGAAVFFVKKFEDELEARTAGRLWSFKARRIESIRNHIGQIT